MWHQDHADQGQSTYFAVTLQMPACLYVESYDTLYGFRLEVNPPWLYLADKMFTSSLVLHFFAETSTGWMMVLAYGHCKVGVSWVGLQKHGVQPVEKYSLLPCFSGMEGDTNLQFLLQGGDLLKVRSPSWKKTRYFRLQEDCKTMWRESKKTFKKQQTCECCPSFMCVKNQQTSCKHLLGVVVDLCVTSLLYGDSVQKCPDFLFTLKLQG